MLEYNLKKETTDMEHSPDLLNGLDYENASVLIYKSPHPNLHKYLCKYVVLAEYKGFPVILSFTCSEIEKLAVRDEQTPNHNRSICINKDELTYVFNINGVPYRVCMSKEEFDKRICNRSVLIHDMLAYCIYENNDSKTHSPILYKFIKQSLVSTTYEIVHNRGESSKFVFDTTNYKETDFIWCYLLDHYNGNYNNLIKVNVVDNIKQRYDSFVSLFKGLYFWRGLSKKPTL